MRKAVDAVNWSCKYCFYVGRNCQSWAAAVRKKYKELEKDQKVKDECCKEKNK
jgi:hypothetical protein